MKAFVTGGTGFVGSHLVEDLLARGYAEVRCLVRRDLKWLTGLPITPVQGGLDDVAAWQDALVGVDTVFHVAGLTRAPSYDALHRANVDGTLNLLRAIRQVNPGVQRVLVTSSLAAVGPSAWGPHGAVPLTEEAPLRPLSMYGRSKAEMERQVAAWQQGEGAGLAITVVRPPAVYGPREADIYTMIKTASRGLFPVVGEGRLPALSLVHVRDLVRGMVDAAHSPAAVGETYFIGSEQAYSWHAVRDAIMYALHRKVRTLHAPVGLVGVIGAVVETAGRLVGQYPPLNREKAEEAKHPWVCAIDKAHRDFGYTPQIALARGMKETVTWYQREGWL